MQNVKISSNKIIALLLAFMLMFVSVVYTVGTTFANPYVPTADITITLDANGGTVDGQASKTYGFYATESFGSNGWTIPTPTKAGYTFGGWQAYSGTVDGGLNSYLDSSTTFFEASDGAVYKAVWNIATSTYYDITYNVNGGSYVEPTKNVLSGATITLPTVTRQGYTFGGWFTSSALSGTAVTSPYTVSSTHTLYAKWTADTTEKSITWHWDGGSQSTVASSTTNLKLPTTLPTPSKDGYVFVGWYYDDNYYMEATGGDSVLGAVDLYAKYDSKTFILNFTADGGTLKSGSVTQTLSKGIKFGQVTLPVLTKNQSKTVAWYYDKELTKPILTTDVLRQTIVVYPKWQVQPLTIVDQDGKTLLETTLLPNDNGEYELSILFDNFSLNTTTAKELFTKNSVGGYSKDQVDNFFALTVLSKSPISSVKYLTLTKDFAKDYVTKVLELPKNTIVTNVSNIKTVVDIPIVSYEFLRPHVKYNSLTLTFDTSTAVFVVGNKDVVPTNVLQIKETLGVSDIDTIFMDTPNNAVEEFFSGLGISSFSDLLIHNWDGNILRIVLGIGLILLCVWLCSFVFRVVLRIVRKTKRNFFGRK